VLVAGEETNKNLSTWLRAAAAAVHQSSENEKGRERERCRISRRKGDCSLCSDCVIIITRGLFS
jgi:hypothetical protein